MITIAANQPRRNLVITLGTYDYTPAKMYVGKSVPELSAIEVESREEIAWRPAAEGETLLVFAALWHPTGRALVEQAQAWADEHDARLAVMSIDWSLAQAEREAAKLHSNLNSVFFAGPGGLKLADPWSLELPAQAYLVSSSGKVLKMPPAGKLP